MYPNHNLDRTLHQERAVRAHNYAAQAHPTTLWSPGRSLRPLWVALIHVFFG